MFPFHRRLIVVALFSTLNVSVLSLARAEQPAPTSTYFYDGSGRVELAPSETEFLVSVRAAVAKAVNGRPAFLPEKFQPATLPQAAADLEDRLEARDLYVARGDTKARLRATAATEFVLPLLYRPGCDVPIYPTNRVALRLKDAGKEAALREIAGKFGCAVRKQARGENRYLLIVKDTAAHDPIDVANAIHETDDLVEYAHPDFFLPKVTYSPPVIQDPLYLSLQWHLDGDTSKGADANSDINVEGAWDSDNNPNAEGSPSVRVSILDECVEKWHPDLLPNFAAGIDLDNDPPDDDPSPDGGQRHGTSCAGVAVAAGNTIGVRGAAPNCGLIGVKFFGATIAESAEGFYFSVDPNDDLDHSDGAAVLSNSWGYADGTLQPPEMVNAINFAALQGRNGLGCLVLFASANNDHTVNGVSALAQLPNVMAVGGTNSHAEHTEFSDVGPEVGITTPTNDRGDDGVREPWLDITTVDNQGTSGYNGLPDLDYTDEFGGTSSATPLAAGVLALIISQDESMTASQARAILQHTAVRLDEPYGRFDGVTGHSHRFGFGRADAAQAVAAAHAGLRWPDRIKTMNVTPAGSDVTVTWSTPTNNYAGSLLVRSTKPFEWMPTDGQVYTVSEVVAPGVAVVAVGPASLYIDVGAASGGFFYAAYPFSASNLYGFGAKGYVIQDGITLFYDSCESVNPGWTTGGTGSEWARGTPTSGNSIFGQVVYGSGPMAGTRGTRAIGGNNCWGTDLASTYNPGVDAYLDTPLINLTGVSADVFLEYYDWCLLETFYDSCKVEVVDVDGELIGYVDDDTGGDYDWTRRVYDLTPFVGQAVKIRFRITSDDILQRDGWFLDEVRVRVAANIPLPPTASNTYTETTENTPVAVTMIGSDPNPSTTLSYVVESLPLHGTLSDPNGGVINSAPYTLLLNGNIVNFTPQTGYQGPDLFTYHAFDGALSSNTATARMSIGTPLLAHDFPFDTDPGWATEGAWAFGVPQGLAGDPTGGYTGSFVYGYNLSGAYTLNLPPKHLTMLPINCTGLSRVTLSFARWLGVEAGNYDNASIEVSTDGIQWQAVWENDRANDLAETAWGVHSYNIGEVADDEPFVQVRWKMGPTDSNTVFAGWNVDDVQLLAIGTPQANQPPLASPVNASTAKNRFLNITLDADDQNGDPLSFSILSLPEHGTLSEAGVGNILSVPHTLVGTTDLVKYTPDTDYAGTDAFTYGASDGLLDSNVAGVSIEVIDSAAFPFLDDFETGDLSIHWKAVSTSAGRIRVTDQDGPIDVYHVTMDSGREGTYSANELTLAADLFGASIVLLQYDWKDYGEEATSLPASWTGSVEGDGVGISADGITWFKVANLFDTSKSASDADGDAGPRADNYQTVTIDLDAAIAAAGINYNRTFRIRFQQYDNQPIATDGIAIDNVRLVQGTGDPLITTSFLPVAQLGQPYGPVQMMAAGGDPPLTWSTPTEFFENDLGSSLFTAAGTALGLNGDDIVMDYALPFSFPFFGQSYSSIKIASDGWINFGSYVGSISNNSEVVLRYNKRIAVLWEDFTTVGGNVYADDSMPGEITIRWAGVTRIGLNPVNFSATLFDDGRIRFDYGSGNVMDNPPTIGVSAGDQVAPQRYFISSYDTAMNIGDVNSLLLDYSRLPPGLVMNAQGLITGTPTEEGTFSPLFKVIDDSAREDLKSLQLVVSSDMFGDFDGDNDVDDADLAQFEACFTGEDGGMYEPICAAGDADSDNDIGCTDWLAFQDAYANSQGYAPTMDVTLFLAVLLGDEDGEFELCFADMNHDGLNDGRDIALYVAAALQQP